LSNDQAVRGAVKGGVAVLFVSLREHVRKGVTQRTKLGDVFFEGPCVARSFASSSSIARRFRTTHGHNLGQREPERSLARWLLDEHIDVFDSHFEPEPMLDAWMHEEVVRLCLMRSGNIEVADWEEYQLKHDDEKPKSRRANDAPQENTESERAAALGTPSAATRKARAQIQARQDIAPRASRSPPASCESPA
jgi:hypothetical protein